MKRICYFILILFFPTIYINAQPNGIIFTPKGDSIEYYNGSLVDTAFYRIMTDSLINSNGWDATMVAPASGYYNCHSFAWHTSEGGNECWVNGWKDGDINFFYQYTTPTETPTNIIQYWINNGGYHQIQNKIANAKVFYGSEWSWEYNSYWGWWQWVNNKDHSAIVDSDTDYFISKWGPLPSYKHLPEDCPYVGSNLSLSFYYIDNPVISSTVSGSLCDDVQRTYSESAFSHIDFEYDWGYTSPLTEVSDDDESSYIVEGTSQSGQGTVSLTVTTLSGATAFVSKNVWVGTPIVDYITDPAGIYNPVNFYAVPSPNCGTIDSYTWIVSPDAYIYSWMDHAEITFPEPNTYYIGVKATNTCGSSNNWAYKYFMYEGDYLMSPNPASTEVEITISDGQEEGIKNASLTSGDEFTVTILDNYGVAKIQKKYYGKKFTVPVNSLKDGNYFVRISNEKLNATKQLIIKR